MVFNILLDTAGANIPFDGIPQFSGLSLVIGTFFGVLFLELMIYLILYKKTRIDQAFVRTGAGGVKVTVDSGLLVLPLFHALKTVYLCQHSIMLKFTNETKLYWSNHEQFEGSIFITIQIPPENTTMIINAARNFIKTETPNDILMVIEPAFRASIREYFRTYRMETFDFEPSTIEVRLSRSLEMVTFAFGLKVRAVYIHKGEKLSDSSQLHIENLMQNKNLDNSEPPTTENS
ncbi:MAG: hypothetical protein K8S87_03210 [Planctomycetes bacterium]|nr:hypothetical protein [Planctomycetota bacterium]